MKAAAAGRRRRRSKRQRRREKRRRLKGEDGDAAARIEARSAGNRSWLRAVCMGWVASWG